MANIRNSLKRNIYDPSQYYKYEATPTQLKRIHRHANGHHTDECKVYDFNMMGIYCRYKATMFWPKPFITLAIDRVSK